MKKTPKLHCCYCKNAKMTLTLLENANNGVDVIGKRQNDVDVIEHIMS